MNILWHSVSPFCQSGYANVTRELVRRIKALGHKVTIATKHRQYGSFSWEGTDVVDGTIHSMMVKFAEKFDYVVTFWDIWRLSATFPKEKWVGYIPVSTEKISTGLAEVAKNVGHPIAMSRHGERELKRVGITPKYAPHGVDFSVFKFQPDGRRAFREKLGLSDDDFLVGSVGLNYADDRKGFVPLLQAFAEFKNDTPKAHLYIHTGQIGENTTPLVEIAENLGVDVAFPDPVSFYLNLYKPSDLANIYSAMDAFVLPTRGEGFGIPIIEAQACGTPVYVSDTTSGPELCKSGGLIWCRGGLRWTINGGWRREPQSGSVSGAISEAYEYRFYRDRDEIRRRVEEYSWDNVWATHWEPIIRELEAKCQR